MTLLCARCHGDLYRPVVAWGRTFCEAGCAHYFETHFPNIVAAYDHAFPRSARGVTDDLRQHRRVGRGRGGPAAGRQ